MLASPARWSVRTRGVLFGATSGFTWGADAVLISVLLVAIGQGGSLGAVLVSMLHDGCAALWLLLLFALRGRLGELLRALRERDARYCVLGALLGGPLAMTCYLLSIDTVGVAVTTTVTASYPLLGVALSVLILRERVSWRTWVGLVICLLGVLLTAYTPESTEGGGFAWAGLGYAVVAALGWASEGVICAYGMKSERIAPDTALLIRETTSAVTYLVLVLPLMHLLGGAGAPFLGLLLEQAGGSALLLAGTALVGMLSFLCWYTSINHIGAAGALCLNVTYSFWGIVLSVLFLGQALAPFVLVGCILILLGVSFATLYAPSNQ